MEKRQREQVFRDPVYGYISVEYNVITKIINSSEFQRLRRVKQLAGVPMAYHGAEHSRFSHSIGAYHVATLFLNNKDLKEALSERDKILFLATALLHDIGHGPYSHAFEDVFKTDHEIIGTNIILNSKDLRKILDEVDLNFAEDITSIILKQNKFPLLEQLISSQLDVDRLDYLLRDAYFCGVTYGNIDIDRLIRVMRIHDGKIVFKSSGIHAIESYLISRYHMYFQVYFHRVARNYELVLEKIYLRVKDLIEENYKFMADVRILKEILKDPSNIKYYLMIDDYYINGLVSNFKLENDYILKTLATDFMDRRLWNYSNNESDLPKDYTETEKRYFEGKVTLQEQTYNDETKNMAEQIFILKDDLTLSTLDKESRVINSLVDSGKQQQVKFFYRDR
ncbi:HD domain-containing protein [Haploplasma modicum]|jgi:uncharacterized protein|uniref:HD domain-containing protein n=1 Tax=Haploplasma modicum TaxID=2150 RepID=UPI00138AC416|nr:HD domain-containing protein [Haploplasma modicum]MCR1808585.1 HD domain-containing protein [Haploplasma modicum]